MKETLANLHYFGCVYELAVIRKKTKNGITNIWKT